jgi:SAM-dependent methyltransferase
MNCFSHLSGRLLMAGGGDLPETHVTIANHFADSTFLDISYKALEIARIKFGQKGEYINASILNIPKSANYFDAVYCAHVIYHIDRDLQKKAVREFIRVTRPGGRMIIIYGNPDSLPKRLLALKRKALAVLRLRRLVQKLKGNETTICKQPPPYRFTHPLSWWTQFRDECDVDLIPWDVMGNTEERNILINDTIAQWAYRFCSWFETKFPKKAVEWWSYPLIVLSKKE